MLDHSIEAEGAVTFCSRTGHVWIEYIDALTI